MPKKLLNSKVNVMFLFNFGDSSHPSFNVYLIVEFSSSLNSISFFFIYFFLFTISVFLFSVYHFSSLSTYHLLFFHNLCNLSSFSNFFSLVCLLFFSSCFNCSCYPFSIWDVNRISTFVYLTSSRPIWLCNDRLVCGFETHFAFIIIILPSQVYAEYVKSYAFSSYSAATVWSYWLD